MRLRGLSSFIYSTVYSRPTQYDLLNACMVPGHQTIERKSCVVMDVNISKAKAKSEREREGLKWGDIIGEGKSEE